MNNKLFLGNAPIPKFSSEIGKLLEETLLEFKARRVLIISGENTFNLSGFKQDWYSINSKFEWIRWSEFKENPNIDDLNEGLSIAKQFKPDAVIGVGGGSALDQAKLIAMLTYVDKNAINALLREPNKIVNRQIKLILIPTTAGSGSEATHFSVLYIQNKKYSIPSKFGYADAILINPHFLFSLSQKQKAVSGIDALSQAIESLWAISATRESEALAKNSLRIIMECLNPFVLNSSNVLAFKMALGSHLAGRAIDISKTTAPHALSYFLTTNKGISHGHAVGLTIGQFIDFHNKQESKSPKLMEAMAYINNALGLHKNLTGTIFFRNLLNSFGLPSTLTEVGLSESDEFMSFIESSDAERLSNNPVQLNKESLFSLLK